MNHAVKGLHCIVRHSQANPVRLPWFPLFYTDKIPGLFQYFTPFSTSRDSSDYFLNYFFTSIDCIYCEFKKAFDKVPHQRLLKKVESYGIKGEILGWIQAFLSDRTQQVIVNGKSSEWKRVTSGIPQGNVLGPLLFVTYINDLPEQVRSDMFLFADDTKIFQQIKGNDDHVKLQEDINTMLSWAEVATRVSP